MTDHRDPASLQTGAEPAPPPAADSAHLQFLRRPGLAVLLVRNLLFGLLTLGIYRFWAKTNLRRFLWASVVIDGEPLEYTGRARELLIGFLIVMAIFVPLSVGYSTLQATLLDRPAAGSILSFAYAVSLYLLINAAIWRARRYRLLRTLWRGIRAGQDGSTWVYIGKAALWLLLVPLSLGLATPWALADLARYRIEHTTWGRFRGCFTGTGRGLLRSWLVVMVLVALPQLFCLAVAATKVNWAAFFDAAPAPAARFADAIQPAAAWFGFAVTLGIFLGPPLYAWFLVRWQRWYVGHSEIGPLRFASSLRLRDLFLYGILLVILPIVYFAAVIAAVFTLVFSLKTTSPVLAGLVAVPLVLVGFGGIRLLIMLAVFRPVLGEVIGAITVDNLAAAATAQQSQQPDVRFGEGLADSFEIGIV